MDKFTLQRVPLDGGGYDQSGSYWGVGYPLYWYTNDVDRDGHIRAKDREDAKKQIRNFHPGAKFYN